MNMTFQSCVKIINEWDIVAARQLGRKISKEIGFGTVDQARITTAISELAEIFSFMLDEEKSVSKK